MNNIQIRSDRSVATTLLGFIMLFMPITVAIAENNKEGMSDAIYTVSELKSKTESRVNLLISLYEDKEINNTAFRKGKLLYEDARAAFNAWIESLSIELDANRKTDSSEFKDQKLKLAAQQAQSFLSYVDELFLGEPRSSAVQASIGLVEPIIEAGLKIWMEYRSGNDESRKRVVERINNLKWKSFETLQQTYREK